MLQSIGSQRIREDLATENNDRNNKLSISYVSYIVLNSSHILIHYFSPIR